MSVMLYTGATFVKKNSCLVARIVSVETAVLHLTVTDWDNMGRVTTQTRRRAFQTLGRTFQTVGRAFSFFLNPQLLDWVFLKLGRVFQKLGWAFQRLGHMFWNKPSVESIDLQTQEFLIIWFVKSSLHMSNNSPELLTKLQISAFNFAIFFLFFSVFFFFSDIGY